MRFESINTDARKLWLGLELGLGLGLVYGWHRTSRHGVSGIMCRESDV